MTRAQSLMVAWLEDARRGLADAKLSEDAAAEAHRRAVIAVGAAEERVRRLVREVDRQQKKRGGT